MDGHTHENSINAELIDNSPKLLAIVEGFIGTLDAPDNSHAHHYYNDNLELFNLAIDTIAELRGLPTYGDLERFPVPDEIDFSKEE